ncbi:DUF2218 domain-containing protein [Halopseudomonas pachastrellae]|nr:DUF2218 domain-containing protein [Halopseudomonas pachastrellae]
MLAFKGESRHAAKQAQVSTTHASRYIKRLCKHFAHKVESTWDEQQGVTDFPFGRCVMQADGAQLALHCTADDDTQLERVCWVVTDHLERSRWRWSKAMP